MRIIMMIIVVCAVAAAVDTLPMKPWQINKRTQQMNTSLRCYWLIKPLLKLLFFITYLMFSCEVKNKWCSWEVAITPTANPPRGRARGKKITFARNDLWSGASEWNSLTFSFNKTKTRRKGSRVCVRAKKVWTKCGGEKQHRNKTKPHATKLQDVIWNRMKHER